MFARTVRMNLKPDGAQDFASVVERDVVPLLQKQKGFRDELTVVVAGGKEAVAISLWDRQEDAEAYNGGKYSEVLKILGKVVDGPPHVQGGKVSNSTFHSIPATSIAK